MDRTYVVLQDIKTTNIIWENVHYDKLCSYEVLNCQAFFSFLAIYTDLSFWWATYYDAQSGIFVALPYVLIMLG